MFRSDATCIICREEMTTAKKLICGHLFHVHCLRSWLERQHTCPTCRALVVPPENGASTAGGQHGAQPDTHQQGNYGDISLPTLFFLSLFYREAIIINHVTWALFLIECTLVNGELFLRKNLLYVLMWRLCRSQQIGAIC